MFGYSWDVGLPQLGGCMSHHVPNLFQKCNSESGPKAQRRTKGVSCGGAFLSVESSLSIMNPGGKTVWQNKRHLESRREPSLRG